jgi:hypothetical protein
MSLKKVIVCTLCQLNGPRCPVEQLLAGSASEIKPLLFCRFYQPTKAGRS